MKKCYTILLTFGLACALALDVSAAKGKEDTSTKKNTGKAKSGFAAMDRNKDGKVSQKEYISYVARRTRERGNDPRFRQIRNRFDSMDQNGDLFLSKEEYEKYNNKKNKK